LFLFFSLFGFLHSLGCLLLTLLTHQNPQFDFLRPNHPLNGYFKRLVQDYTRVLLEKPDLDTLAQKAKDKKVCEAASVGLVMVLDMVLDMVLVLVFGFGFGFGFGVGFGFGIGFGSGFGLAFVLDMVLVCRLGLLGFHFLVFTFSPSFFSM
jgi:hypothetical protein